MGIELAPEKALPMGKKKDIRSHPHRIARRGQRIGSHHVGDDERGTAVSAGRFLARFLAPLGGHGRAS